MKDSTRRKLKKLLEREIQLQNVSYQSRSDHFMYENILDGIDEILKEEEYPHIDFSKGLLPTDKEKQQQFIDADSSGAQRAARSV